MRTQEEINEMKQKIAEFIPTMEGLTRARNPFELRYFVIGKHDDRIQQYKQAIIECEAKYKAIAEAMFTKRERDLDRKELLEKGDERSLIKVDRLDFEEKQAQIAVTGAAKEVLDFIYIIENEYADLMDKTEEELLQHETEYWEARFTKQIHIDLMCAGRISEGNRSTLASMPKEIQERILIKSMIRTEEVKQFENSVARKTMIKLAESYPAPTAFIAPPDYTPLKLRKDAPDGYPQDRIVEMDRVEIMVATLHRPGDNVWLSESFYIPAGKNYISHWVTCDGAEMIGEWRNRVVKDALSLGCEHLFWVDDDLMVENDALMKLYAHNLDIVGGWYPMKTPVIQSATMISVPGSDSKQAVPLDSTGLIEVDWSLATGLSLVKMDVFKSLPYPWYLTTDRGTEDTFFSARTREAGIKSWLDTSVKAIHVTKETGEKFAFPLSEK